MLYLLISGNIIISKSILPRFYTLRHGLSFWARIPQNVAHRCKRLFSSEVYLEKCCTYAFCHIFFFSNRSATYPELILYFVTQYLSNTYFASKALHLIILYNARIRARV